MKLLIRYIVVASIAILGAVIIITSQRNKAKTSDQSVKHYTLPLINLGLNAVVINKSIIDVADRIQSGNAMTYSLRIDYIDINSKQKADFLMNFRYQHSIAIGDTVTKEIGDEFLKLHKKDGDSLTIPVK